MPSEITQTLCHWLCDFCPLSYATKIECVVATPLGETHCAGVAQNGQSLAERDAARFRCSLCDKEFQSRISLTKHARYHRPARYACEMCGARFKDSGMLKQHQASIRYGNGMCREHRERKQAGKYACAQCGMKFAHSNNRARHVRYRRFAKLSPP